MYGRPKVVAGDDASSIDVSVETPLPLSRRKMPNDESSCTSAMAIFSAEADLWSQSSP